MLLSLIPRLRCPACGDPSAQLRVTVFRLGDEGHVDDGVLVCPACAMWYPIEEGLLELVAPALRDQLALGRFRERFAGELAAAGATETAGDATAEGCEAQVKQRQHFDWFAEASTNYDAYQHTPFWRSADGATFARWAPRVRAGDWLLDVGCANGRSAWPFAPTGATIVGCDISRKLIAQAIAHAKEEGLNNRATFFVADADRLPLRDATFDVVVTYGALHHLPDPARTCRDIQRIVRPGGVHFGSENNKSAMRPLFDALMKVKPLWVEEAGEEPLMSESMVREWLAGLPASIRCHTHVFVPPHLVNLLGEQTGGALLRATDACFGSVPGIRSNGGLLVFELRNTRGDAGN